MIGGVCGGIAESIAYPPIDPTIVRLLWALMTIFTGGIGFLAYILLWLIMPME
jgi:phage shock protein PspC (stress-responsive transcriptional regulator)